MTEVQKFDTVRNKKNGRLYCVIGLGIHSETLEDVVIYSGGGGIWVRPYELFLEKFTLVQRLEQDVKI